MPPSPIRTAFREFTKHDTNSNCNPQPIPVEKLIKCKMQYVQACYHLII